MGNVIDFNKVKDVKSQKVHNEEEVHEIPIGSKQLTIEDLMEEVNDAYLMGKQDTVYQFVATFLQTPEAVKANITGVEIKIENGYINCYWQFGENNKEGFKDDK